MRRFEMPPGMTLGNFKDLELGDLDQVTYAPFFVSSVVSKMFVNWSRCDQSELIRMMGLKLDRSVILCDQPLWTVEVTFWCRRSMSIDPEFGAFFENRIFPIIMKLIADVRLCAGFCQLGLSFTLPRQPIRPLSSMEGELFCFPLLFSKAHLYSITTNRIEIEMPSLQGHSDLYFWSA
jgi:hypothetical protein